MEKLDVQAFLKQSEHYPIIDVRSPSEYAQAHIPGAINIPLFSDEERAKVGTTYKQKNQQKAVLLGLKFIGKRMHIVAQQALKIAKDNTVLVHCWRGGMRSQSMAWLFSQVGLKTFVLEGGYKVYRHYVLEQFEKQYTLRVLSGYTGSGKTDILKQMSAKGQQVIDLEGLAHHKGSAFGSIGQQEQNSTEQFENYLYQALSSLDISKTIWVEDESQSIGKNFIPKAFFSQMREAPVVRVLLPTEVRVKRLVEEYTYADVDLLIAFLEKIKKRLGPLETQQAIEALRLGDKEKSVRLALRFYDKAYAYGLEKRDLKSVVDLSFEEDNIEHIAQKIIEHF